MGAELMHFEMYNSDHRFNCMPGPIDGAQPVLVDDVTELLLAWGAGDEGALSRLIPLVYQELHRLAVRHMAAEQVGHPLQATALVHETYLSLLTVTNVEWQNRGHFYAICARLMRRILIDFARSRNYQKRGANFAHIQLEDAISVPEEVAAEVLALDEALTRLSAIDSRKGEVVEMRFFGGCTVEEIAAVLRVSPDTVQRDWKMAKAWLLRELSHESPHGN